MVGTWNNYMVVQYWPGTWLYLDKNLNSSFESNHFNIHGIWPNYDNDTWPEYCPGHFNKSVLEGIWPRLETYWTNYINTTEFIEHEYYKHITCLMKDSKFTNELMVFNYGLFKRAEIDLYSLFYVNNVEPNNKRLYNTGHLIDMIKWFFKKDVVVTCLKDPNSDKWLLDEVRFCFEKSMKPINCNEKEMKESCKSEMVLYNIVQ